MGPAIAIVACLWTPASAGAGQTAAELLAAEARALYNAGRFEDAIARVEGASADPEAAASMAVVWARARLERFRAYGEPADLDEARNMLRRLPLDGLSASERAEWEIGVAEALYLEGQYGPAAEIFRGLLEAAPPEVSLHDRRRLLDWWATAVDRDAAPRDADGRRTRYERLTDRMERERARDPESRPATYWIAAAARGAGDLDRAWDAAIAGWVRAGAWPDGAVLREDLDRLVLQAIVPEQARRRTGSRAGDTLEVIDVMAGLAVEWEGIKARWGNGE